MVAAAAAWQSLATELHSTANAYGSLISGLAAGPWLGPAAMHMTTAVTPHVTWLRNTADLAEQAGAQAAAAAGAYAAAFAATVPPAEVTANRALLLELVATNIFGQNTPAIAVVEADYAEMWAQDAGAMYSYAGSSAEASALPAFAPPAAVTTPTGLAAQATAVGQAASSAAAAAFDPQAMLKQITTALHGTPLAGLNPLLSAPSPEGIYRALGLTGHTWNSNGDGLVLGGALGDFAAGVTGSATLDASTLSNSYIRMISPIRLTTTAVNDLEKLAAAAAPSASHGAGAAAKALEALPQAVPGVSGLGSGLGGIGKAAQMGGLSVPNAWATATPGLGRMATSPLMTPGAAAEAAAPSQHMLGGMPLTGGAGRGLAAAAAPRYGFHPTVMARPPFAG